MQQKSLVLIILISRLVFGLVSTLGSINDWEILMEIRKELFPKL